MVMRVLGLLAIVALLAGCGQQSASERPFPPEPPNTSYRVSQGQFFRSSDPVGVMRLTRNAAGNPTSGTIVGKIHGWPFPHLDPSGDNGEGLFDYRTDFTVTRNGPNQLPESAEGIRTVYFNSERQQVTLTQPGSTPHGQPVIRESVKLRFSFQSPQTVVMTITARQQEVASFEWEGAKRTPPAEPPETSEVTATYAHQYGGYVFR